MWPVPLVDHVEDLEVELDVGAVVLLAREPMGSNTDLVGAMDREEGDLCLIAYGPAVPSYAA